jgi:N-acetylglutamate synthase/N-acetylornithine aminotransferase
MVAPETVTILAFVIAKLCPETAMLKNVQIAAQESTRSFDLITFEGQLLSLLIANTQENIRKVSDDKIPRQTKPSSLQKITKQHARRSKPDKAGREI